MKMSGLFDGWGIPLVCGIANGLGGILPPIVVTLFNPIAVGVKGCCYNKQIIHDA
jgi:hypothetical protein